ncbi:MAG: hypothetical protein KF690_07025 [Bacteroidetes bacterium]|nr:hypothetical protein [Bacteroidota bacterium]
MQLLAPYYFYDLIHHTAYSVVGIGLALLLWGMWFRRRMRNVVHAWRKSQMVVFTIVAFIINFTFFVLACFFFTSYVGRLGQLDLVPGSAEAMLQLGIDSLLLLLGSILGYLGIQFFYTQYITPEGIVLRPGLSASHPQYMLRWADVRDYYVHSDYPVSLYHFLIQPSGTIHKVVVKVPYYAQPKFEYLLQGYMEQQEEIRAHSRSVLKRISRPDNP